MRLEIVEPRLVEGTSDPTEGTRVDRDAIRMSWGDLSDGEVLSLEGVIPIERDEDAAGPQRIGDALDRALVFRPLE